jgi:predicted RNase H-like HicB family nuclease
MASYIGLMRKEPKTDFGVNFPDFPGCITAGRTMDEAYRLAAEALAFHVEGMTEDGEPLPEPSSLETVMADPENRDAVPFMVPLTVAPKVVRVNVTMDEALLRAIDAVAPNRSAFLAEGARRLLADRR